MKKTVVQKTVSEMSAAKPTLQSAIGDCLVIAERQIQKSGVICEEWIAWVEKDNALVFVESDVDGTMEKHYVSKMAALDKLIEFEAASETGEGVCCYSPAGRVLFLQMLKGELVGDVRHMFNEMSVRITQAAALLKGAELVDYAMSNGPFDFSGDELAIAFRDEVLTLCAEKGRSLQASYTKFQDAVWPHIKK
jgi:hypothetical protein